MTHMSSLRVGNKGLLLAWRRGHLSGFSFSFKIRSHVAQASLELLILLLHLSRVGITGIHGCTQRADVLEGLIGSEK